MKQQRAPEGQVVQRSRHIMEWQAQARRADLLVVLQARFQRTIPEDLEAAIAELRDADELTRWVREAAAAASLEEFQSAVGH
jgi:hypothetical protein